MRSRGIGERRKGGELWVGVRYRNVGELGRERRGVGGWGENGISNDLVKREEGNCRCLGREPKNTRSLQEAGRPREDICEPNITYPLYNLTFPCLFFVMMQLAISATFGINFTTVFHRDHFTIKRTNDWQGEIRSITYQYIKPFLVFSL